MKLSELLRTLARNFMLLSASLGVTMVLSLAIRMYIPRVVGPENLGIFYFAESLALIFFNFLPLGIAFYINKEIPPKPEHTREILGTIVSLEVIFGLVILAFLYMFMYFSGTDDLTITLTLIMGSYAAALVFSRNIMKKIFIALDRVKLVSIVNVISKLVTVVSAGIVLTLNPSLKLLALCFLGGEALGLIILTFITWKEKLLIPDFNTAIVKKILRFSFPFYVAMVLTGIYSEIDMAMLGKLANASEVGYYGAAYKLIGIFLMMIPLLTNAVIPALSKICERDKDLFTKVAATGLVILAIMSLPLASILSVFSDHIALFLYGPEFGISQKIVCYLTPILIITYLNTLVGIYHGLVAKGQVMATIVGICIVLNIALDAILIPQGLAYWGEGGGGLAVTATTIFCETAMFALLVKTFPGKLLNGRNIYVIAMTLAPSIVAIVFYEKMIELSLLWRFALIFSMLPYVFLFRIVSISELKSLFNTIKDPEPTSKESVA